MPAEPLASSVVAFAKKTSTGRVVRRAECGAVNEMVPAAFHAGTSEEVEEKLVALLPRLRRYAMALCHSAVFADDLVQGACL